MVQKNAVLNPRTAKHREPYRQIISYIGQRYAEHIDLGQIAKQFGYSAELFSRSFKRYTGASPLRHIKRVRASVSRELLRDTDMRVGDITLAVGEPDARTFVGDFKREYGMAPARYRSIYRSYQYMGACAPSSTHRFMSLFLDKARPKAARAAMPRARAIAGAHRHVAKSEWGSRHYLDAALPGVAAPGVRPWDCPKVRKALDGTLPNA